jgi:hypothetical protein
MRATQSCGVSKPDWGVALNCSAAAGRVKVDGAGWVLVTTFFAPPCPASGSHEAWSLLEFTFEGRHVLQAIIAGETAHH